MTAISSVALLCTLLCLPLIPGAGPELVAWGRRVLAMCSWPSPEFFDSAATIFVSFFYLSPFVQMVQVFKSKGAALALVNPPTIILMFFNTSLWLIYGIFVPMWPAVPGNLLGCTAASFYLCFCWGHVAVGRCTSPKWGRGAAGATLSALVLAAVLALYGQLGSERAQEVGYLAMGICICMYASPLSELGQVIRERDSAVLPPVQCLMQFVTCALWIVVGVNSQSAQILVCNVLGLMLASTQLAMIALFPAGGAARKHAAANRI